MPDCLWTGRDIGLFSAFILEWKGNIISSRASRLVVYELEKKKKRWLLWVSSYMTHSCTTWELPESIITWGNSFELIFLLCIFSGSCWFLICLIYRIQQNELSAVFGVWKRQTFTLPYSLGIKSDIWRLSSSYPNQWQGWSKVTK